MLKYWRCGIVSAVKVCAHLSGVVGWGNCVGLWIISLKDIIRMEISDDTAFNGLMQ